MFSCLLSLCFVLDGINSTRAKDILAMVRVHVPAPGEPTFHLKEIWKAIHLDFKRSKVAAQRALLRHEEVAVIQKASTFYTYLCIYLCISLSIYVSVFLMREISSPSCHFYRPHTNIQFRYQHLGRPHGKICTGQRVIPITLLLGPPHDDFVICFLL
jgi:hypothetical protein